MGHRLVDRGHRRRDRVRDPAVAAPLPLGRPATALALMSRSSVGLAGVAALAILCGGNVLARIREHREAPDDRLARLLTPFRSLSSARTTAGRLPVLAPGLAAVVPVALYAVVNWIKFRTLFSVPFWDQGFTMENPIRQEFLRENNGTLFGIKFIPTTLVQYLRPNASP